MRRLCAVTLILTACGDPAVKVVTVSGAGDLRQPPAYAYTILTKQGGRVDWAADGSLIAYDKMGDDGYYDVHTMRSDGTPLGCLTCGVAGLPTRDVGQPAWHPSLDWLVFQAEKDVHQRVRLRNSTSPGGGTYNDLWVLDMRTKKPTLLYAVESTGPAGTLHPHFSRDGKLLSWSVRYADSRLKRGWELGAWKIAIADFVADAAGPRLENIRYFIPGAEGFYENHGFSPDGTLLIFTSPFEAGNTIYRNNIYSYNYATSDATQLTHEAYNEHASFSPDGKTIVWMTDKDVPRAENGLSGGTEYWRMNADGSAKARLTYFNTVTNAPERGKIFVASDVSWGARNTEFIGYVSNASDAVDAIVPGLEGEWIVKLSLR